MIGMALAALFLVLVILLIFNPEGLFRSAAAAAFGVANLLPTVQQPAPVQSEPLPAAVEKAKAGIVSAITSISKTTAGSQCLISLQSIDQLGDFRVKISSTGGSTSLSIPQSSPGGLGTIERGSETITGVSVCIADPQALYDCYFEQQKSCKDNPNDYKQTFQTRSFTKNDFAPYGFKIDEKTICFIPKADTWRLTNFIFGCKRDPTGLREPCISELPQRIKACSFQIRTGTTNQ